MTFFAPFSANAANVASYSYKQVNSTNGVDVTHENAEQYDPLNAPISVTERPPLGTYDFVLEGTPLEQQRTSISSRTTLAASLEVNQPGGADAWKTAEANAETRSSLVDLASVQGAEGMVTVRFDWTVTGTSRIFLDTSDFREVDVTELSTHTILMSTIEGAGGLILDDLRQYPRTNSFNKVYEMTYPAATGGLMFDVQWPAGSQMPVSFDLFTRTNLNVAAGLEKTGFDAELDAEFFNTATLVGVQVIQNGEVLPDARLVSEDGFSYPVPEPGGRMLLLTGVLALVAFRAKRFQGRKVSAT